MEISFDEALTVLLTEHCGADWQDECWAVRSGVTLPPVEEWLRRKRYFAAWRALRARSLER
jgi:hypothetical protein